MSKKKFNVHVNVYASFFLGTFEATSKEEAEDMAYKHENCSSPILCHQCSRDIELCDVKDLTIYEEGE